MLQIILIVIIITIMIIIVITFSNVLLFNALSNRDITVRMDLRFSITLGRYHTITMDNNLLNISITIFIDVSTKLFKGII